MTIPQPTPEGSILVGIDISKLRNDVLIEIPGKTRRIRLTVLNCRAEHNRFVERLLGFDHPVLIGFEATGNYHRPLAYRLIEAGFTPRLISSLALARTREALHNGWDKNDPKDAQVILRRLRPDRSCHDTDYDGKAQRYRPACLAGRRARPHRRDAARPVAGIAALELEEVELR